MIQVYSLPSLSRPVTRTWTFDCVGCSGQVRIGGGAEAAANRVAVAMEGKCGYCRGER